MLVILLSLVFSLISSYYYFIITTAILWDDWNGDNTNNGQITRQNRGWRSKRSQNQIVGLWKIRPKKKRFPLFASANNKLQDCESDFQKIFTVECFGNKFVPRLENTSKSHRGLTGIFCLTETNDVLQEEWLCRLYWRFWSYLSSSRL